MTMVLMNQAEEMNEVENTGVRLLVGCIDEMEAFGKIKTRFFYVNTINGTAKDITLDLCQAINLYNQKAKTHTKKTGEYAMVIPMKYRYGMAEYSHGCGLSHYLQEENLAELQNYVRSVSIENCKIKMLTPDDLLMYFGYTPSVFDEGFEKKLVEYLCL